MLAPRRSFALLLSALTLAAAGCGSGESMEGGGDNELASSDAAEVLQAQRTIDAACGSDGSATPDRTVPAIAEAVGTIAGLTQQYPDRLYETGNVDRAKTMTTISEQVTEQLRRCGIPAQADRLGKVVS